LLAHDRDIRELMGARDLYIAEVYDVERNGQTRKAFGRVILPRESRSFSTPTIWISKQRSRMRARPKHGACASLTGNRL